MLQLSQRPLTASPADAELFADRVEELAAVRRAVELGFNVYLQGPSGSGRTSLLRRLQAELESVGIYVNAAVHGSLDPLVASLAALCAQRRRSV